MLTKRGRLRRQFEALLHQSFPRAEPVAAVTKRGGSILDFTCAGFCAPVSKYLYYRYEFRPAPATTFRLASRRFVGLNLGNYGQQILIKGRPVACGKDLFLADYRSETGFGLYCSRPGTR